MLLLRYMFARCLTESLQGFLDDLPRTSQIDAQETGPFGTKGRILR